MVALLKRETHALLDKLRLKRVPDYRPRPQAQIDYDALYTSVAQQYPKIMKRLAE